LDKSLGEVYSRASCSVSSRTAADSQKLAGLHSLRSGGWKTS